MPLPSFGHAFVTGSTESIDFPTVGAFQATRTGGTQNAFVTELDPAGSGLVYSTYLGSGVVSGLGIALDGSSNIYVMAWPVCTPYPGVASTQFGPLGAADNLDVFAAEFNSAGRLLQTICIGGSSTNYVGGMAVDTCGNIYLAGTTASLDFPTQKPIQPDNAGEFDWFMAKIATNENPAVSLSPDGLGFGEQLVSTASAPQTITLSNFSGRALDINQIAITGANSGDFAETNNCPSTLASGASCVITLTFTPTATGGRAAEVSITDNVPGSPQTAPLGGFGTMPAVALLPTSITFGDSPVGTATPPTTAEVLNTGNGALEISSIAVTGDFAETNTCGSTVLPEKDCLIYVTFKPMASGTRTGTVSIQDNATLSPQVITLSGTGTNSGGSGSPPAFVQVQNNLDRVNTDTSLSVNITTQPGDLLLAFCREGSNATDYFTVTDSAGQKWTQTLSGYENESSTGPRSGMFYVANSAAVSSVTVNFTTAAGVTKPGIMVMEFSGAALTGVADGSVKNKSGASVTAETSGPLTTSNANDILIFAGETSGNEASWTAGAGYTIPNNLLTTGASGSNVRMAMQFLIVTSTQSNRSTSMSYPTANWNGNIFAAFK